MSPSWKRTGSKVSFSSPAPAAKQGRVKVEQDSDDEFFAYFGFVQKKPGEMPQAQPDPVAGPSVAGPSVAGPSSQPSPKTPRSQPSSNGSPQSRKANRREKRQVDRLATVLAGSPTRKGKGKARAVPEDEDVEMEDVEQDAEMNVLDLPVVEVADPPPFSRGPAAALAFRHSRVSSLWVEGMNRYCQWMRAQGRCLTFHTHPLPILQTMLTIGAQQQHLEPNSSVAAILSFLSTRTRNFLSTVARGQFVSAVNEGIETKALVESKATDKPLAKGQVTYVRVISSKDKSPPCYPIACMHRYMAGYPADLAWAATSLVALSQPLELIAAIVADLDLPDEAASTLITLLPLFADGVPKIDGHPLYFGVSDRKTPFERMIHDKKLDSATRFMNYMEINFDFASITPYSIPDCSVLLSTGLRTDREAGDVEVGLIEIISPPALNSAVGGFIPHFLPSPSLQHIVAAVQPSITHVFGSASALDIQTEVNRLLDNQKKYLELNVTGTTIHASSYEAVLQNGPGVCRTAGGIVPGVRLLDTISLEDYQAKRGSEVVGGIWDVTTGKALQSFRNIVSHLHPALPSRGDLEPTLIVQCLGPTFNLWPLSTHNCVFWLHALWTSRILIRMRCYAHAVSPGRPAIRPPGLRPSGPRPTYTCPSFCAPVHPSKHTPIGFSQ
ncbi:hypothetical protein R3P38DRAFT_3563761 [Favolaschia claudopus]|uniref:Uncharacterized protein n=1 Tax=Favolaschia claudopus TaxID=2862362 RepID=A0AAW0DR88_9AGAR